MIIDDLTLLKCLGRGSFGEVYLTSKKGTQLKFATKKISKKLSNIPKFKQYLNNEIQILKEISNEYIIKLYEVKETTNYNFLVMELCNGGELSKCLEDYQNKYHKPFSEEIVQYLMRQIISGIKYLHNNHILHRDIKLDNILVNFDSEEDNKNKNMLKSKIKIIDFGFARHLTPKELAFSQLGSPINMDPGILNKINKIENFNDYGYDQKADIWSLGTICYEMLMGKSAFESNSMSELVNKINNGKYYLSSNLSKETLSFLKGMLKFDLKKRKNIDELYKHPFLTKPYNTFNKNKDNDNDNDNDNDCEDEIEINIKKSNNSILKKPNIYSTILIEEEDDNNNNNINELFLEEFYHINDDFIYIEPKLIPIIPGIRQNYIGKDSEYTQDDFFY